VAVVVKILSQFDDRGVRQAQKRLERLGSSAKGFAGSSAADMVMLGDKMQYAGVRAVALGKTLTKSVTLPLAAVGVGSLKMASDFGESMSHISSLVGASGKQMRQYRDSVLAMAQELPIGPKELADSLYFVTSAGFEGAAAMRVLRASAMASAAGLGETQTVADAVTSAVNAYGESALSATRATDVLLATVREGKAEPEELAASIGRVISPAQTLGVTFGQVGGAVASLSLTGLDAAEATTALRGIIMALIKPSKEAQDTLKSLGLSYGQVRASIREKGLLATLEMLRSATKGNDQELAKLFPNVRALNGVLALTGANGDKTAEVMRKVAGAAGDTATAFARAKKNDPSWRWKQLKASAQAAAISIGNELMPVMHDVLGVLSDLLKGFNKLSPGTRSAIVKIGLMAAAAGPLIGTFGKLVSGAGLLVKAIGNIGLAMSGASAATPAFARAIARVASLIGLGGGGAAAGGTAVSGVTAVGTAAGAGGAAAAGGLSGILSAAVPYLIPVAATVAAAVVATKVTQRRAGDRTPPAVPTSRELAMQGIPEEARAQLQAQAREAREEFTRQFNRPILARLEVEGAQASGKKLQDILAAYKTVEAATEKGINLRLDKDSPLLPQYQRIEARLMGELDMTKAQADAVMATMFKGWRPLPVVAGQINPAMAAVESRIARMRAFAAKGFTIGAPNVTSALNNIGRVIRSLRNMQGAAWSATQSVARSMRINPGMLRGAYQRGGLVTSPRYALVGEAGPELILPLTDQRRTLARLREAGLVRRSPGHAVASGGGETYNVSIQLPDGMVVSDVDKFGRQITPHVARGIRTAQTRRMRGRPSFA